MWKGIVVGRMPAELCVLLLLPPSRPCPPRWAQYHQLLQLKFPPLLCCLKIILIQQAEGLASGRGPVLIRAHASRDGAVHEVVMRLEVTEYGTSQVGVERTAIAAAYCRLAHAEVPHSPVPAYALSSTSAFPHLPPCPPVDARLEPHIVQIMFDTFKELCPPLPNFLQMLRLEPHIVVSNRTPVPLQLLQTRLALASPPPLITAASGRGQQPRPQGAVVAEGGHSFSNVASSGFFTSPLWTGGKLWRFWAEFQLFEWLHTNAGDVPLWSEAAATHVPPIWSRPPHRPPACAALSLRGQRTCSAGGCSRPGGCWRSCQCTVGARFVRHSLWGLAAGAAVG